MLWTGTAASAVDLHPTGLAGFDRSVANGTDGLHQVGYANLAVGGASHALLWSGTSASAVDLHPTNLLGFDSSIANAVSGLQQVGYYGDGSGIGGKNHALLWTGTAASAVDLQPTSFTGFDSSIALGTNGLAQVGYVYNSAAFTPHAVLWTGSAASAIDLAALLPFTATSSFAYTIDAQGNAWGTATDATGVIHAVEWSPVPEPASVALATAGAGAAGILAHAKISNDAGQNAPSFRRVRCAVVVQINLTGKQNHDGTADITSESASSTARWIIKVHFPGNSAPLLAFPVAGNYAQRIVSVESA